MSANKPTLLEGINNWIERSITIKLIVIGILIALLMIPVSMIENLIGERQYRQEEAIKEVSSKWGEKQTVTGIVLTIPYRIYTKQFEAGSTEKFKLIESKGMAHFLPESLKIKGDILPETRYRGIYEVIVYNSKINLTGNFTVPDFSEWKVNKEDIDWGDAYISLGLSDLRSIQDSIFVQWDDRKYFFNPGLQSTVVVQKGMTTPLPLKQPDSTTTKYNFSLNLDFNGSSSLNFIPLGKVTQVNISSKWQNPSFNGAFLPDKREINSDGFTADWEVLHLNRSYPQKFNGTVEGINESSCGVNLFAP
ncbi:MAG: cell envelope integrity protein CreD, partial [Ignavibacteriae bacterium]|nr:cell envelope integrity protein CreD [Ignavibacteriota bacterium]